MIHDGFNDSGFWSDTWVRHLEKYLAAPPRCGIWLKSRFPLRGLSVLECAGGSCRDSRYLHEEGVAATGSDFDDRTLAYLERRFAGSTFPMRKEDAFGFSFPAGSFDIVFHNGFWICFRDDGDIRRLLREQARISSRYAVALVHNAGNRDLVERFAEKGRSDDLYNVRFFRREELEPIVRGSGIAFRGFSIEKFGGPVDRLFALERKVPFLKPVIRWLAPRLYRFQPWTRVERIALIIELEARERR